MVITNLKIWFRGEENGGVLETTVDGKAVEDIRLYSSPNEKINTVTGDLSEGFHRITFTLRNYGKGAYMKIERFCIAGADLKSGVRLINE